MMNYRSWRLHRRTLLTGAAVLGASIVTACNKHSLASGQRIAVRVEQNTTKRRGVGLRAFDAERASPGFWKYQDRPAWNFFSPRMGNAQHLPNGSTLICESSFGRFFEVTKEGEIVWEYVNPFVGRPFFAGSPDTQGNLVFRALRYSAEEIARAKATEGG